MNNVRVITGSRPTSPHGPLRRTKKFVVTVPNNATSAQIAREAIRTNQWFSTRR